MKLLMSWSGKASTPAGFMVDISNTEDLPYGRTRFTSIIQIWTGKNWRICDGSRVFRLTNLRLARALKDAYGGSWLWFNLPDFRGVVEVSTRDLGVAEEEILG